ncbi:hypothetical protein GGF31_000011 [Allomyces arbusculus]|nr:hypothetical protein GGF31_000011 [Allomyces arbusculus]
MNILPHKRQGSGRHLFHVYNNDNVARVRRDEAEAEEKEHQRRQQVIDADRAARLEKLRSRRRGTAAESGNANAELATVLSNAAPQPEPIKDLSSIQTPSGHFNFFKELEAGTKRDATGPSTSTNPSERTKSEPKRDPFTTYLDPGKKVRTPWYTQMAISDQTRTTGPDAESEKERRERRTRDFQDPIHAMGIRLPPPDPAPSSSADPTRDSGATRPGHLPLALPPPRPPSPPEAARERTRKRRRYRDDGSDDDVEHDRRVGDYARKGGTRKDQQVSA